MNAIYKYTCNNEVIYIGKTDNSLELRINDHAKQNKFQPYLRDCKIEYFETNGHSDTEFAEKTLIKKYNPVLNVVDRLKSEFTINADINVKWKDYKEYLSNKEVQDNKISRKNVKIKQKSTKSFKPYSESELFAILSIKDYLEKTVRVKNVTDKELLNIIKEAKRDLAISNNDLVYPLNYIPLNSCFCFESCCCNIISCTYTTKDGKILTIANDDNYNVLFNILQRYNKCRRNKYVYKRVEVEHE